jgi:glutathione synthase/RimK-type ligase-like ATP-grasp enzyme
MTYDVTILTETRYENPAQPTPYQQQVLREDGFVRAALEAQGLRVARVDWASPYFDWSQTRCALFRTTWDYFTRIQAFSEWLDRAAAQTRLLNSASLVRWNMDKHYLADMAKEGVPIVETVFLEIGENADLSKFFTHFGVESLVLKPCIAAGSLHTYHFERAETPRIQAIFDELIRERSMMVQAFQENVLRHGEVSVMMFDGTITHAVVKKAKAGDFRVQQEFGGSVERHEITDAERALAQLSYNACAEKPLYGRVDIILDNSGVPVLSELELIEPELFFRLDERAAHALAAAVAARY